MLGSLYLFGQGVTQNDEAAAIWYKRAADKGNYPAIGRLGALYYKGVGVPIDKEKGAKMIKMACQSGQSRESCKILEQL
ncbi:MULTISPECIES: tetratricopeptide repeat protein [Providencia]|uniref:tetratricopeptide repeat protein n=1 Tax=Providencia TaxID=586 RepID=UPI001B35B879|nr:MULTISPECIES: SEL1-like repeat protein [Providencia]MBQ0368302.1 sel1 repeat family protein [Providencia rettgeri]MBQ0399824.1 sel1 repeat family protein [Providencia rettgeri]